MQKGLSQDTIGRTNEKMWWDAPKQQAIDKDGGLPVG